MNFEEIITFGQGFTGPENTELAFVFSEYSAGDGIDLVSEYPAVREDLPPTEDASISQANRIWVKLNNGDWQQLKNVPQVTNIGLGQVGTLLSGISSSMVIKVWATKNIVAGWVVAKSETLDAINSDRTTGIALIRTYINFDQTDHPLAPNVPFTSQQVSFLSVWLEDHYITNEEFAALFDVAPAQLSNWLQNNPRWKFAKQIHDRFA